MNKISKVLIVIIFSIMTCLCTACQEQPLNDLELKCKGSWTFLNFYIRNKQTFVTTSYIDLDDNVTNSLDIIVKNIGDYYNNSTLNLDGTKNNNLVSGTYIQNGQTTSISWWCPEDKVKIGFHNFTIYAVEGSANNPTTTILSEATCLVTEDELCIGYVSDIYYTYIIYTK